jgi:hypothetical protein
VSRGRDGYLRQVDRQAIEQGWKIEKLPGGHLRHVPPDRSKPGIVSASTPSDRRGTRNFVAALRRNGLVLPGRRQRAQDQGEQREEREFAHDKEIENMPTTNTENRNETLNGSLPQAQPPPPPPPDIASTFPEALRSARVRRGNTHKEVADFLETAAHVVRSWEAGTVPRGRYYNQLVELYPELRALDRPRRAGISRSARQTSSAATASARTPAATPTAASVPRGLRLLRDARRLREALVPILQGALEDGIGLSDLLEMLQ